MCLYLLELLNLSHAVGTSLDILNDLKTLRKSVKMQLPAMLVATIIAFLATRVVGQAPNTVAKNHPAQMTMSINASKTSVHFGGLDEYTSLSTDYLSSILLSAGTRRSSCNTSLTVSSVTSEADLLRIPEYSSSL